MHWAAQNGKLDAVKYLIESYDNIDVLIQNTFGRSVLTEAFQSQNPDVIEVCLSHSSASEEKLMPDSVRNASATASNTTNSNNTKVGGSVNISDHMEEDAGVDTNEDSMDVDESDTVHNPASDNAVYHYMSFLPKRKVNPTLADTLDQSLSISDTKPNPNLTPSPNPSANSITTTVPCMRLRELPITRADNPFGSDTSPELDTTGLGIWPASVLAAKWVMHNRYNM